MTGLYERHTCHRRIIVVAAIIIMLTASYSGYWYFAVMQAVRFVEDLQSGKHSHFKISHGSQTTNGFPFTIKLHLPEFEITNIDQSIRWRSDEAILEMQPWNLRRYRLALTGTHLVEMRLQNQLRHFSMISKRADFVGELSGDHSLSAAALNLEEVNIVYGGSQQAYSMARLEVLLSITERMQITHLQPSLELSISADSLSFPSLDRQPLGSLIKKLRAGFRVLGPISQYNKVAVNNWRQDGGTLEITWFQTVWGPLDFRATGTVTVDAQLRPLAAMTTEIRGYVEAVNALAEKNIISNSTAKTGQIALNLLAAASVDDTPPVLTLPLTVQDGALYLGPIKLAQVPSLFFEVPSLGRYPPGASQ